MIRIDNTEFYTAKETADKLQVTVATIKNYLKQNKLKSQKVGGKHYISKEAILNFLQGKKE